MAGYCEHGNEPSGFIRKEGVFDHAELLNSHSDECRNSICATALVHCQFAEAGAP